MGNHGHSASDLVRQLGMSKQSTSELVEILVRRGYLERGDVAGDRRRVELALTARGRAAATAIRKGVEVVDGALRSALTAEQHDGMRAGLIALCDIHERWEAEET
jgi:DNA-binding MarR family transcriptional regulator